jgi:potassium-transporting ATPase potassium-binding subunit
MPFVLFRHVEMSEDLPTPVGIYLARVLEGERTWLDPVLRPLERLTYRLCGINSDKEMKRA